MFFALNMESYLQKGVAMLPFLEVESINQKSAIHTKNTTKHNPFETQTEDSQGFAQIFNTLTQPATKKDIKKDSTLKIPLSTQKDDKLMPSKSNFLKILDEKYNLTKDFKSQKIPQPRSAKDLLEFSSIQNKEKTLKDLSEVAKNLQLNLKKISTQTTAKLNEKLENAESKNTIDSKLEPKTEPKNNPKKPLFNAILQDKNLTVKDSLGFQKKAQEIKQNKESKKTDTKEPINTNDTKHTQKLESKNDSIILDSKPNEKSQNEKSQTKAQNSTPETPKTKVESKTNTAQEAQEIKENLDPKNTKIDSKTQILQDSKAPQKAQQLQDPKTQEPQAQTLKEAPEPTQTQKLLNIEANIKEKLESKNSKFENKPNPTQMDFIAKNHKEAKKDSTPKNEKPQIISKETLKDVKETRQSPLNINQEILQPQEQTTKQESFLDNLLKTSQKSQSETKEQIQQPKEKEVRKESEKAHQENYQNSLQTQRESRLSLQNTFTHFSDRLRDAITNYRPPVTKISLELNPQNLGSVELTIAKNGDKLSVQISSNQNALQLIMQNTQDFKNALGNLGFQNVEIDFKDNQGNSLGNGDFSNSSGNQQGGFQQGQQQNSENFKQNSQQNPKNSENWNENSLYIDKKAKNPYTKLAVVELSFSYYA